MVGAIQSAAAGMNTTSQAVDAVSLRVLRKALDHEQNVAQQMVNMVTQSSVYNANAQVPETSPKLLDIVV